MTILAPARLLERPAPTTSAPPSIGPARPWRLLLLGCLALATASLLLPSVPTYDPWAWLIWGREVLHGDLVTTGGPSWKPLPVLFTAPLSVLGESGAPLAWLVVARAGGILAFAMAYRLGVRLSGAAAGLIGAIALILCDQFIFNFARGNSEGILVAVCLWAIERHLDGRRNEAFVLGLAAALLRPEIWPILALYGCYVLGRDRTLRTRAIVLGGGVVVALAWFVPEYVGSGNLLRAASRARDPNPDSLAFAAHPFVAVFESSYSVLTAPVYVGAIIAVVAAVWARDRLILTMAAVAAAIMVAVAAMTQAGFAGNLRYIALPAAVVCVLAGVGWVHIGRAAWRWRGAAPLAVVAVAGIAYAYPYVHADVQQLRRDAHTIRQEADLYGSVPDAIAAAGGAAMLQACGPVFTGAFQTQTVAWYMHLHQSQVQIFALPPGVTIATNFDPMSLDPRFPTIAGTAHWVVGSSCAD